MSSNPAITNFYVPIEIRNRFDEICRLNGRTRTAALVQLMEDHIIAQGPEIARRNEELEQVDRSIEKSRRLLASTNSVSWRLLG